MENMKLPEGWKKVKLSDYIFSLETGKRPKGGATKDGIPSLGGEHINSNGGFKITLEKLKYVPIDFYNNMKSGIINKGDILIVKDGATTGKVAYVNNNFLLENACINEHVFLLRTKHQLNGKFLSYFFRSNLGQVKILNDFRGATIGGISKQFVNFNILLPPLSTQKKIVQVLDKAQELIDKRKEQIEKLAEFIQSVFIDMFGDPMKNSKGWDIKSINDVMLKKSINGFFTKNNNYINDGNSKVIWISDFIDKLYCNTSNLKCAEATSKEIEKYKVSYGDILFCRSSLNVEGIGKASCIPKNIDNNVIFECHIIKVSLDKQVIPEFFQVQSTLQYFRKQILKNSKTATMTTISQSGIEKCNIIVPPLEKQKQFVDILIKTEAQKELLQRGLEEMENNFNSLMQKAFKGELEFK